MPAAVLERADGHHEQRLAAIGNLALGSFDNQRQLLEQLLSPQEPAAIRTAVLVDAAPASIRRKLPSWCCRSGTSWLRPSDRRPRTCCCAASRGHCSWCSISQSESVTLATLDPRTSHGWRTIHPIGAEGRPANERGEQSRRSPAGVQRLSRRDSRRRRCGAGQSRVSKRTARPAMHWTPLATRVGPNLAAMVSRGRESLLFNILVPNGEVDPRFLGIRRVDRRRPSCHRRRLPAKRRRPSPFARPTTKRRRCCASTSTKCTTPASRSCRKALRKSIDQRAMADLLAYLQQAAAAGGSSQ